MVGTKWYQTLEGSAVAVAARDFESSIILNGAGDEVLLRDVDLEATHWRLGLAGTSAGATLFLPIFVRDQVNLTNIIKLIECKSENKA